MRRRRHDDKFAARARARVVELCGARWLEFYALALAMESRFRHLYSGQHEQKKQPNAVPSTTDRGSTNCEMIWNGAQQKPW